MNLHTQLTCLPTRDREPTQVLKLPTLCQPKLNLGWGFLKEKKKVTKQENTHSSKKTRTRRRKKELAQENTHSTKKASTKKITRLRKHPLLSILLSTTLYYLSIRLIKTTKIFFFS